MSKAKTSNRKNAPQCATFVDIIRSEFGEAKVLYVEEGGVKLGEPMEGPFASCAIVETGGE